jgi:hypothetical protein
VFCCLQNSESKELSFEWTCRVACIHRPANFEDLGIESKIWGGETVNVLSRNKAAIWRRWVGSCLFNTGRHLGRASWLRNQEESLASLSVRQDVGPVSKPSHSHPVRKKTIDSPIPAMMLPKLKLLSHQKIVVLMVQAFWASACTSTRYWTPSALRMGAGGGWRLSWGHLGGWDSLTWWLLILHYN